MELCISYIFMCNRCHLLKGVAIFDATRNQCTTKTFALMNKTGFYEHYHKVWTIKNP